MITLRGHHLFCLAGYRGMGYSEEYAKNMTAIHNRLRENPNTVVHLVNGPDCLCEKYPKDKECHCLNENIYERDAAILSLLNLQVGQTLSWGEIEEKIKQYVKPSIIHTICSTCEWKTYGYCEKGLQRICAGKGLKKVK